MMISFDDVPREEMEAICTPMHRVLSASPQRTKTSSTTNYDHDHASQSASSPAPARTDTSATGALYLGSMTAIHDLDLLRTHRITHVVQVLETPWAPQPEEDSNTKAEFTYHRIDIEDRASTALRPHLTAACDYIGAALSGGENVLVHCQQGVSRSPSIVIAYLIRDHGMTYDAAYDLVKQQRLCVRPNAGFVKALKEWESVCNTSAEKGSR